MYQLIIYIPEEALEKVKTALFDAGAGQIGNYSHCAWQTLGTGQFQAENGSNPYIGTQGKIEQVREWRVEIILKKSKKEAVLKALKQSHPYETPAYHLIAIES